MYSKYTATEIAKAYIKQSQAVWKGLEMLVAQELKEQRDFIIEGYHIQPQVIINLQKMYGRKNFKCVFLIKTDTENILSSSIKYTDQNDWFVKRTRNKKTYMKIAVMISELGTYISQQAERFNLKVFRTDNNFEKNLKLAEKYIS